MQKEAINVVKKLQEAGHIAYFAGGFVRDYLMGHESDDIDIVTSASIPELQALFPKTIPVGIAFGILIVVEQGHQYEVATFRKDLGYTNGRHPDGFERADPEEDAKRRDFTINGMFYDPLKNEVYDFVGGKADLAARIIRAIGNPNERFAEDRLRMVRAVRYATRFGFTIEKNTFDAICLFADKLLPAVAIERIFQEFSKMAKFNTFGVALKQLFEVGLLQTIFPALSTVSKKELFKRCDKIAALPRDLPLIGAMLELFSFESAAEVEALCHYLKVSTKERKFALFLFFAKKTIHEKSSALDLVYFFANPDSEHALIFLGFDRDKKEQFFQVMAAKHEELYEWIYRIVAKAPLILSADLEAIGIKPGIEMGRLLKEAEKLAIIHGYTTKEQLLSRLRKENNL